MASVRTLVRSRETGLVLLAVLVGSIAGAAVTGMGLIVQLAHELLFGLGSGERLSGLARLPVPMMFIWPAAGGLLMAASIRAWGRLRDGPPVDPIEANALRGGRLSLLDSTFVAAQTLISNGFGASVGLEAGYTQAGSGLASAIGASLHLRRNDLRVLVGCGAAGAIAAAFGSPLTGAFYGFEVIIGAYSVATVAPVAAASLAAALTAKALGGSGYLITIPPTTAFAMTDYILLVGLGLACAAVGILLMRSVFVVERVLARLAPAWMRPAVGGLAVGGLALVSPQVLSAGHGALHVDLSTNPALVTVLILLALKMAASVLSLGAGFRGGLFFASLLIGALLGKVYAAVISAVPGVSLDPLAGAVVGMGAFAVAIVGGPLTMTFLVLDATGDYGLTGAVLAASIVSGLAVRETFGYSFSTWRLHLRGESIRSAHDVGWTRSLTVGRLMRSDPQTISAEASVEEFKRRFPLGSTDRVILLDDVQHYAGIVVVSEVHSKPGHDQAAPVSGFSILKTTVLTPAMNVREAMDVFDDAECEALAVVQNADDRRVLGLLTEAHAVRRYAEELEKSQRGLTGER